MKNPLIISTTVFVLNLTLPNEITLKFQDTLRSIYGDTEIIIESEETFSIKDIKMPDEEFKYTGFSDLEVYMEDIQAEIIGVDVRDTKEMKMLGTDVPKLEKNEVVISSKQAEKYSYKEGDKLIVTVDNQKYELEIAKIVSKKGLTAFEEDYPIFIANLETVNEIKNIEDGKYESIYLNIENDDKVKEFVKYVREKNKGYIVEELVDAEAIKESLSFISYIMTLIFVLATIMIFFVVSSLNKIIIAERMPVIGTFRSVGVTKNKMNFILILENVVYGLIGGIIGTVIGFAINDIAASLFIITEGAELSSKTTQMNLGSMVIGVVFAVLLEIFISIKAIRKANKKTIKDIIFDVQSTRYILRRKRSIIGIIMIIVALIINYLNTEMQLALTILSIVLLIIGVANIVPFIMKIMSKLLTKLSKKIGWGTGIIASKNIGYNKMIISSSRLIVISVSLIIAILTVSNSFTELFNSFRYTVEDYDIVIQNVTKKVDEYEKLKENNNVQNLGYIYWFWDNNPTYNGGQKFDTNPIILGQVDSSKNIKELDYKIEDLKYDEVLIDEKLAEKNNIKTGDILKINFETLNKELEFKIVGFINSAYFTTSRNVLLINLEKYLENITEIPTQILIDAKEGTDLEKLKVEVKDIIKEFGVKIQTVEEYLEEQEEQNTSILSLFYIIIGLAVMLSFIGIINNQTISFMQRRKELAILNSTCMSKKQLKKMLIVETILANLIACLVAIALGFIATGILDSFLQGLVVYVDVKFNWSLAFKFAGVVFVVLLLTIIIPARRLKKMNVITEIKYE